MSEENKVPNETTIAAMQEAEELSAAFAAREGEHGNGSALNNMFAGLIDQLETAMPGLFESRSDTWEWQYLDLIREILEEGDDRIDRTGVGTRAIFGKHLDIDLQKGFPAVTTKKLAWKAVKSELIWFLEGSDDERRLCEILHGTRDDSKKTIWTDNANADYWKPKANYPGHVGHIYGFQWRHWPKYTLNKAESNIMSMDVYERSAVDQVAELVKKLKENPTDRRMLITAFNVGEIDKMALPPCHMMAQFFVEKGRLSCSVYMRSIDTMLGLPFNIASYALLTHMLAQVCNLSVGRLIMNLGDTHIYKNHLEGAEQQLERVPSMPPKLSLNTSITEIDGFRMDDIHALVDYDPQESIKLDMAV